MRLGRHAALSGLALAAAAVTAGTAAHGLSGPRPGPGPTPGAADRARRLPLPLPLPLPPGASGDLPPDAGKGDDDGQERKQRGVALGMFAEDVSFSYAPLLAEIAALGATHVALIVPLYQTDGTTSDLSLHTRFSPTLELIADTIRAAHRDRLEVTLFPIIRLSHPGPGQWRGTLAPRQPDRWFRAYGELLGDLAAVAAQTGATRLVVGSELSSLDGDLDRWRPLLERIRAVFPGHLVYSANWDHYRDARLFDLVDEEGVVAYFNLRAGPDAPWTEAALETSWQRHRDGLLRWRAGRTRPFVFTEVGYRSRAGSTAAPWDEAAGGTPAPEEQRRAFVAFRHTWTHSAALDGAYVWNWYGYGGDSSTGYTPRGKPATAEVRRLLQDL